MSYVDAYFDRDSDIIRVVERNEGKRLYTEYPVKYTFYYEDSRGKHKSVDGKTLSRIVCKNTKDYARVYTSINSINSYFKTKTNILQWVTTD